MNYCSSIYTLTCHLTGESQDVYVCYEHAKGMPLIDRDLVKAQPPEDDDIPCEFCSAGS